jgi:hypothetical protein
MAPRLRDDKADMAPILQERDSAQLRGQIVFGLKRSIKVEVLGKNGLFGADFARSIPGHRMVALKPSLERPRVLVKPFEQIARNADL